MLIVSCSYSGYWVVGSGSVHVDSIVFLLGYWVVGSG